MRLSALLALLALLWLPCSLGQSSGLPRLYSECSSAEIKSGFSVSLRNNLQLHYKRDRSSVRLILDYDDTDAWMAVGFSPDGLMVGSQAVIGLPIPSNVGWYELSEQRRMGIDRVAEAPWLTDASVGLHDGKMRLDFTIDTEQVSVPGLDINGLSTLLYAVGEAGQLTYHRHRAGFAISLSHCGRDTQQQQQQQQQSERSHFQLHGALAGLAFAVALPIAMATAWFRQLVPSSWIYIHVLANSLALFFALVAVVAALLGMSMRSSTRHMSHSHHWFGIILLLILVFQVVNGFRRPPLTVKRDQNLHDIPQEPTKLLGCIHIPLTTRDKWFFIHRLTAITLLVLALLQMRTGIHLYSAQYEDGSDIRINLYYLYVIVWMAVLFGVRVYFYGQVQPLQNIFTSTSNNTASKRTTDGEEQELNEMSRIAPTQVNVI
jgi:putative Mn2+ efflux pump MntP